ncbi:MAG: alpha/beta hydrolase family protein [Lysobacterales bacterium]
MRKHPQYPRLLATVVLAIGLLNACASVPPCSRQPLAVTKTEHTLTHSNGRQTAVTLWQPSQAGRYPLATFSHGAYSAPERYDAVLEGLAAMGMVVMAPLHIDSELIATDPPPAPAQVWLSRKQDVAALLTPAPSMLGHLNAGISVSATRVSTGHSYGAFGAQVAAGALAVGDTPGEFSTDVDAVVAFSPPGPLPGFIETGAWETMDRPQLLITGTGDILPGFMEDWRTHTAAWNEAPEGDQWLWVGEDVDHYFGKVFGRLAREVPAQTVAFEQAMATTEQFLATYLDNGLSVCASPIQPGKTDAASLQRR